MGIKTQILNFAKSEIMPVADFLHLIGMLPDQQRKSMIALLIIAKAMLRIAQIIFYAIILEKVEITFSDLWYLISDKNT